MPFSRACYFLGTVGSLLSVLVFIAELMVMR
jgi:hypothetical protein